MLGASKKAFESASVRLPGRMEGKLVELNLSKERSVMEEASADVAPQCFDIWALLDPIAQDSHSGSLRK